MLKILATETALLTEDLTGAQVVELTDAEVQMIAGGAGGKEQTA